MTLGKLLIEALHDRGEMRDVHVNTGTAQATVIIADSDRYSVALETLVVGDAMKMGDDVGAFLSAKAAALARHLSYLEEPLAVWELDGSEGMAQLRSSPPQRDGEAVSYWEVAVRAGERPSATLARYRWQPGMAEREVTDYPATFALVARLTDSLATALAE